MEDQKVVEEMTLWGNREWYGQKPQRTEKAGGLWLRSASCSGRTQLRPEQSGIEWDRIEQILIRLRITSVIPITKKNLTLIICFGCNSYPGEAVLLVNLREDTVEETKATLKVVRTRVKVCSESGQNK